MTKLRVAAVQLNSVLGKFEHNAQRAWDILECGLKNSAEPNIIVFPEMALTGYNFKSENDIKPYLSKFGEGNTYKFAKKVSEKFKCHTVIGYPEIYNNKIFNSAMVVNENGDFIFNYRKTHLFDTDKIWGCNESDIGFQKFDLNVKGSNIKTTIGICMDLNPYEFKDINKYEFSDFAKSEKCQLVIIPTNWMNSVWKPDITIEEVEKYSVCFKQEDYEVNVDTKKVGFANDSKKFNCKLDSYDYNTRTYWLHRLSPMFVEGHEEYSQHVIISNRTGIEDNLIYGGTSSIFTFGGKAPIKQEGSIAVDVRMEGSLNAYSEGILVRDLIVK